MKIKALLIFLISFCFLQLEAQVRVSTWDYDFGTIELWENQPAVFEITNTSSKTLIFLPTFPDDDLYLFLPTKTLRPGETVELHAVYYTEKKGRFKRPFKLYTNLSSEPLELSVNGKIELVDVSARTICPGSQVAEKELLAIAEIKSQRAMLETKPMAPDIGDIMVRSFEKQHPELVAKEELRNKQIEEKKKRELATQETQEEEVALINEVNESENNENSLAKRKEPVAKSKAEGLPKNPLLPKVKKTTGKPSPLEDIEEEIVFNKSKANKKPEVEPPPSPPTVKHPSKEKLALTVTSSKDQDLKKNKPKEDIIDRKPTIAENISNKKPIIPIKKEIDQPTTLNVKDFSANNVVFLIDVSTSMKDKDKLPLLKESMVQMAKVMRGIDKVTVITYSTKPSIALQPTAADNTADIISLIESLEASGRTNGVMGLQEAYRMIRQQFIAGGNNQIILATDGLFNQYHPDYTEKDLMSLVRKRAKEDNVKVSVIGFGSDNKARRMMSRLASNGGGNFLSIDEGSSESALVDEIKKQSGKR